MKLHIFLKVLVKVKAASVNPLDWHYMRGVPYIMRLDSGFGRPKDHRLGVDFGAHGAQREGRPTLFHDDWGDPRVMGAGRE